MTLTDELKARAADEGFDLVGIAEAGPVRGQAAFERWLDAGRHGTMAYMERTRDVRLDVRRLLPECRSVVAVAMSYRSSKPASTDPGEPGTVWISRYAWGRDYHKVLKKKLIRLGRWLGTRQPEAGWRACVDTAPVLEREWAARAGLGWIGKNTMLLNRTLGSELFLGLLLTEIDLEPDAPSPEHCGRCTACLDACPTRAFPEPRVLDATRCLAYVTVEHRGPIPDALQPALGDMAAGCDICNEVCPFTKKAPADRHADFQPADHRYRPDLATLEGLDEDGWRTWRMGSALNRIPFEAFRRNLRVVRRNRKQ